MTRCPRCNESNEPAFKFCGACGTELAPPRAEVTGCPHCGARNESDMKFCGECGASLALPLAEVVTEGPVEAPSFRLFDNISVFIATFFGGPVAGAILIARNYSLLGEGATGAVAVVAGILGMGLLMWIGTLIPQTLQLPIAIAGVAATAGIA